MREYICQVCGKKRCGIIGLTSHIFRSRSHPSTKEYYDRFLRKERDEDICDYRHCTKKTKFSSIGVGYLKFCCNDHANKEHGLDEELQKKNSEIQKISQNRTEVKAKSRETAIAQWKDPDVRAAIIATSKKNWTQERRDEVSRRHKQLWKDEDYRNKQMTLIIERNSDPVYRCRLSAGHNTPSAKKNHSDATRAQWKISEYRRKMLALLQSPKHKLHMSELVTKKILNGEWHPDHGHYKWGHFESHKCQTVLFYRSSHEFKALTLLEKDDTVVRFTTEPFRIPYFDKNGDSKFYIPDLLIEYVGGMKKVVEIKPEIFATDENNLAKFEALKSYASNNNMTCGIWTEKDLDIDK